MRKWLSLSSLLIIAISIMGYSYSSSSVEVPEALTVTEPVQVIFPQNKITLTNAVVIAPPFLGSSYIGFKEALAFKESQGDYFVTNTLGYLGKYQFGIGTLQLMGVYNSTRFLNDPKLQEKVFQTNIARNKWILRKDILRFAGKKLGSVEITESGILAAAHLAGPGNVKKYLRSYGSYDVADAYGTNIQDYMKKFSGYDISHIMPARNPKI